MPFLSFIIPVFNGEKYIEECLQSILNQKYQDFEIVIVDDCSNDDTVKIIEKIAIKDTRIKLFTTLVNLGPGGARNLALEKAEGKYLFCIDSDDKLIKDSLPILFEEISQNDNLDMIFVKNKNIFGAVELEEDSISSEKTGVYSVDDFLQNFLDKSTLGFYIWQFVIKREIVSKNNIRFRKSKMGEDIDFIINSFRHSKLIALTNIHFYCYRTRISGSLSTATGHIEHWQDILKSVLELFNLYFSGMFSRNLQIWIFKNIKFLFNQFADILPAFTEQELLTAKDSFIILETYIKKIPKQIKLEGILSEIKDNSISLVMKNKTELNKKYFQKLSDSIGGKRLFIFPATNKSARLKCILLKRSFKISGFLDNDVKKQGLIFESTPIFKPELLRDCFQNNNIYVLINTATSRTAKIMEEQLCRLGLKKEINFRALIESEGL